MRRIVVSDFTFLQSVRPQAGLLYLLGRWVSCSCLNAAQGERIGCALTLHQGDLVSAGGGQRSEGRLEDFAGSP